MLLFFFTWIFAMSRHAIPWMLVCKSPEMLFCIPLPCCKRKHMCKFAGQLRRCDFFEPAGITYQRKHAFAEQTYMYGNYVSDRIEWDLQLCPLDSFLVSLIPQRWDHVSSVSIHVSAQPLSACMEHSWGMLRRQVFDVFGAAQVWVVPRHIFVWNKAWIIWIIQISQKVTH